ncbi:MAG: Glutamyl-Q tRNA(Asp) synthetase [Candidatus Celerinatantimonas neptuna]|nr:MAG: Glutamyl-Q tRNA(Asp) synthetase [Candidatus Celerinatantimonas neptuna]
MTHTPYIGRFAPSPSGPLHFGSLVTAVGSFLQAKSVDGRWLVRIEDIDPPREMPGADTIILKQLRKFGLNWDGDVIYQSCRHASYQRQIDRWLDQGHAYYCQCSRKEIKQRGGIYDGHCRNRHLTWGAIRLHCPSPAAGFLDRLQGWISLDNALAHEDLVIRRSDGLYAYNLAVVVDDIFSEITEIVRGSDLLEPTARQCNIYRMLKAKEPTYLHLPLVCDAKGHKLSKQNHAPALDPYHVLEQLHDALAWLNHPVPTRWEKDPPHQLLSKMAKIWNYRDIQSTSVS